MPFKFTCPYCFKKTLVEDSLSGKSGPCAGCGKTVSIPAAPAPAPVNTKPVTTEYIEVVEGKPSRRFAKYLLQGVVLLLLIAVVGIVSSYVLWPTFQALRERRNRTACMNNLQLIAIALNEYCDTHGSYPPPIVYDDKGAPMHSWRTLILIELGYPSLYAQYNFDQPWDSEANSSLMMQCPREFVSPASNSQTGNESSYFLVIGKGTVFPKAGPLGYKEISDGPSETLLVVEAENSASEWTRPDDIAKSMLKSQIGVAGKNSIGGNHAKGATAVFADGTPVWLPDDLDPLLLDAMISPDGGEPVDPTIFTAK